MKRTESLKRAQDKYRQVATRTFSFRFNRDNDADVIEMIELADSKQDYVRSLIRKDIKERGIKRHGSDGEIAVSRKGDKWIARYHGITLMSDSYDILMNRIKDRFGAAHVIKTEDQKI